MPQASQDTLMRLAAFQHVQSLIATHDHLTANEIKPGFQYQGQRIPLMNPQRGIYKPQQMEYLLSIKTVYPKPGGRVWYDDQRDVHKRIFEGEDVVEYAFMGDNPASADNRWLKEAMENKVPIIYFLGISPGRYHALLPAYVVDWNAGTLKARIAFGRPEQDGYEAPEDAAERKYILRTVKQRLHQAMFREAVMTAYGGRCALSGLPEPMLLDAAHIISDKNEKLGQPVVPNGIPLSKIHHSAFDAHLIGIDPDYRLHVSGRLMEKTDGPMLDALKRLHGGKIHLPARRVDWPDPERLEMRFQAFENAN